jgi:hypothetical protein
VGRKLVDIVGQNDGTVSDRNDIRLLLAEFSAVYYRVYAPDGAIPSKTAPDPSNPFIGRIKATSVPPPLDAASLKRTLAQAEGIPDLGGWRTDLYRLPSHQAPMDDTEKVSILGLGTGIGLTATDALALVFIDDLTDEEKHEIPQIHEKPAEEVAQYCECRLNYLKSLDTNT